eukprot:Nk52_evm7s2297 gene=Nk52_evmTU7s2297
MRRDSRELEELDRTDYQARNRLGGWLTKTETLTKPLTQNENEIRIYHKFILGASSPRPVILAWNSKRRSHGEGMWESVMRTLECYDMY